MVCSFLGYLAFAAAFADLVSSLADTADLPRFAVDGFVVAELLSGTADFARPVFPLLVPAGILIKF